MIGPVLVHIVDDGENSKELYYLCKSRYSQGIFSQSYFDTLDADQQYRIVKDSYYETYEEITAQIDHVNTNAGGHHDYIVELSMNNIEISLKELMKI